MWTPRTSSIFLNIYFLLSIIYRKKVGGQELCEIQVNIEANDNEFPAFSWGKQGIRQDRYEECEICPSAVFRPLTP